MNQKMYKMSLEPLDVSDSKEDIKDIMVMLKRPRYQLEEDPWPNNRQFEPQ